MASVTVLVPWWPATDDLDRVATWEWVRRRYETLHPDWRIVEATGGDVTADAGEPTWSKAQAVNAAAAWWTATDPGIDVFVVADADCIVTSRALMRAAEYAFGVGWAVPHSTVYRLDHNGSAHHRRGAPDLEPTMLDVGPFKRKPYFGAAGGGIVAVNRHSWEVVGGYDDRFVGWGSEDVSFGWACETLISKGVRVEGPLWHFEHRMADVGGSAQYTANRQLEQRYRQARLNPAAMQALIDERVAMPLAT